MSKFLSRQGIEIFLEHLGRRSTSPGRCYITGGSTALLLGWRNATIDIDIKFEPEPAGAFSAISELKRELAVNVELAAPDNFLPPVPGWQDRSIFIARHGLVDFYHYDLIAQCLAKLSRGHDKDLTDVTEMLKLGLVAAEAIEDALQQITPSLIRYPALNAKSLQTRVLDFLRAFRRG